MRRPSLSHKPLKSLRARRRTTTPASPAVDFAERVAREGTAPLPPKVGRVPPPLWNPNPPRATEPSPAPVFRIERADELIEGYREGLPARVRRRLRAAPRATLDLHGYAPAAARRELARFLAGERRRGVELVLIIVGKGLRSRGGQAVLRAEIGDFLSTNPAAEHVLAFRTAPREHGGTGSVLVLLAGPAR